MRRSHLLWSPLQPGGSPRWPMTDAYNCCPWLNCSPLSSSKKKTNKKTMNKSVLSKVVFHLPGLPLFPAQTSFMSHHRPSLLSLPFCTTFYFMNSKVLSLFDFSMSFFPSILSSSYLRGRFCHHSFVAPKAYLLFDRRIVRREKGIM